MFIVYTVLDGVGSVITHTSSSQAMGSVINGVCYFEYVWVSVCPRA